MIVAGAISILADDRSGSNVKVLLPIAVAFAILALAEQRRPHLTLIQEVRAERQDRKADIEIGDAAFDERWVVKCVNPAYASAVLTPALRAWLMTFDADKVTPVLEARDGDVVAVIDGEHLDRIPALLDMADTLARHLGATLSLIHI